MKKLFSEIKSGMTFELLGKVRKVQEVMRDDLCYVLSIAGAGVGYLSRESAEAIDTWIEEPVVWTESHLTELGDYLVGMPGSYIDAVDRIRNFIRSRIKK